MTSVSFVEMVADIRNVKYREIVQMYERITGEEFDSSVTLNTEEIRELVKSVIKEMQSLEPLEESDVFAGINIFARGASLPMGYSVVYDPALLKIVESVEVYDVKATVTHTASQKSKNFIFSEYAYPPSASIDIYGREIIPMQEVSESECKSVKIAEGKSFVRSNGSAVDELIFETYKEVLGREYIGGDAIEYWSHEVSSKGYSADEFKFIAAVAGSSDERCVVARSRAIEYLASRIDTLFKSIVVNSAQSVVPVGFSVVFSTNSATVTHISSGLKKVFDISVEQDVFYGITVDSRSFSVVGYSISFVPDAQRQEYNPINYSVKATLTHTASLKTKEFTFSESAKIIDPFLGISISSRGQNPGSLFSVVYDPVAPKAQSDVLQTYGVKATLTHTASLKTKEFTFSESVQPLESLKSPDGRFVLLRESEVLPGECVTLLGVGAGWVKPDESDPKELKIKNAYKSVLGRESVDLAGMNTWYDSTHVNASQDEFNMTIAFEALPYKNCPNARTSAIAYLTSHGWLSDLVGIYKNKDTYVQTKAAWSESVDDTSKPIYKTTATDYSASLAIGSCTSYPTLGAKGSSTRREQIKTLYRVILLREGDSVGVDYWTNDSSITDYKTMCNAFRDAGLAAGVNYLRLVASLNVGSITFEQFLTYGANNTAAQSSWYIKSTQTLVGYESKIINHPAEYAWQTQKEYAYRF